MAALDIFPISLKVRGRLLVIVGGGVEALAKARLAVKTSAKVLVIARKFSADFSGLEVETAERALLPADLEGAALVFVAENSPDADLAISEAQKRRIALNVVDQPEFCDFYTPAIVDRAPVSIAISTTGAAPVLARLVRARIEAALAPNLGFVATLAGELRYRVAQLLPDGKRRRRYFEELLGAPSGETKTEMQERAFRVLDRHAIVPDPKGYVFMVGAGPGPMDLLTLRAQRLLQEADVIVHETWVPQAVVQMGRRDAKIISVESGSGQNQSHIKDLLVDLASKGEKIVWLVHGDPVVWGHAAAMQGGLQEGGIESEIVPGVGIDSQNSGTAQVVLKPVQATKAA